MSHKSWLLEFLLHYCSFRRKPNIFALASCSPASHRKRFILSPIAEALMMPSGRAPRYPLRSHDLPMNPELFTFQKTSSVSQSRMLDNSPQSNMPSLTNHAAHDYCYTGKPYPDGEHLLNAKAFFEWQNLQDSITSLEDANHCQMSQSYSSLRFESTGEQTGWNSNSLNGAALEYSSVICPRSYPFKDVDKKTLSAPDSQIHPPSSYVTEPQNQESHQTATNSHHSQVDIFSVRGREMYRSHAGGKLNQRCSSGSPRSNACTIKTEFAAPASPNLAKGSEENYSPATMMDLSPPSTADSISPPSRVHNLYPLKMINKSPPPHMMDDESDGYGSANAEPYAQLIYRALKSAPGHAMVLKEIYEWFENNTDKAKNGSSKGWQNSIRHNLSMNGV